MNNTQKRFPAIVEVLFGQDMLGVIIRVHLEIERLLIDIINSKLPFPEHLKDSKINFKDRVNLALSLGLENSYSAPLLKINSIRNKFAHNANYKLNKQDLSELYESMTGREKEIAKNIFKDLMSDPASARPVSNIKDLDVDEQLQIVGSSIWIFMDSTAERERNKITK